MPIKNSQMAAAMVAAMEELIGRRSTQHGGPGFSPDEEELVRMIDSCLFW
jgi:hypothetical protein